MPPGMQAKAERAEGEILKIYSLEDQGATFRAYVVKYMGSEVVVSDTMAIGSRKVGDKISFTATRVEGTFGEKKVKTMSFQILPTPPAKPK